MSLQTTLTVQAVTVGQGDLDQPSQQVTNTNPPPRWSAQLLAGNTTLLMPTGYTLNGVWLKAPVGSANAKSVGPNAGNTMPGWTFQPVAVPAVAGGSVVIVSAGNETIEIIPY